MSRSPTDRHERLRTDHHSALPHRQQRADELDDSNGLRYRRSNRGVEGKERIWLACDSKTQFLHLDNQGGRHQHCTFLPGCLAAV